MIAFTEHFSDARLIELAKTVIHVSGYDATIRSSLLGGIPPLYVALLPGGGQPPMPSIMGDLRRMNRTPRLTDGTVPLKTWLDNAVLFSGGSADAEPLREASDAIRPGGGPQIDVASLPEMKEVIIHQDDMVPYVYMKNGLAAARSVAKLLVPRYDNGRLLTDSGNNPLPYLGTGWLVTDGLLLTNLHVVNAREDGEGDASESDLKLQAKGTKALFDYDGQVANIVEVDLGDLVAWDRGLDYALVRIEVADRRALPLGKQVTLSGESSERIAVNIIQHPDGKPKKFGIRNNLLTAATETELRYFTDTMGGSSGSPVLNDHWEAVGLHRGAKRVKGVQFNGRDVAYINVGTQIAAIRKDLKERFKGKCPELQD